MMMAAFPLILASASPRRKEILEAQGVSCIVVAPDVDESSLTAAWKAGGSGDVGALVMSLACAKANAVLQGFLEHNASSPYLILAADTVVYDPENKRLFGKPKSSEDAVEMLMSLSGRSHEVYTGVALVSLTNAAGETVFFDRSTVTFDAYDEQAASDYVASGEPLDKAGAYAIQGIWGAHVTHIEGDYQNVVGLPWYRVEPLLKV